MAILYIVKTLNQLKEHKPFILSNLYKDEDDKKYVVELFRKVVLNHTEYQKEIVDKTPNWDADRIAQIDNVILKIAIAELLYFPLIPPKVTLNEYLEIAKDYSTPNSNNFVNGVLDKLVKEFSFGFL